MRETSRGFQALEMIPRAMQIATALERKLQTLLEVAAAVIEAALAPTPMGERIDAAELVRRGIGLSACSLRRVRHRAGLYMPPSTMRRLRKAGQLKPPALVALPVPDVMTSQYDMPFGLTA